MSCVSLCMVVQFHGTEKIYFMEQTCTHKKTPINHANISIISMPFSYFSSGWSLQSCNRAPLLAQTGVYFTG